MLQPNSNARFSLTLLGVLDFIQYFDNYGNMKTIKAVKALAAIAQDSRLAIFRALVQAGPNGLPAGKIAEALDIPPSSLSFHMKELTHAEMVSSRQEGRYVIYAANFSTMNELISFLTDNCCGGNPCTPTSKRVRVKAKEKAS